MNYLLRPRIWPSFSPSCRLYEPEAWRPRVFLRQAQDRLPLRRTIQVRLGTCTLRLPGTRRKRLRCAWHAHLRGLATAIHEISGLDAVYSEIYGAERLPGQVIITYQPFLTTIVLEKNFRAILLL